MPKIAVNTRLLKSGRLEGIGWFTWQSLRRVVQAHPEVEFHFIFDAKPARQFIDFPNVVAHVVLPPARRIVLYKLWFDYLIPAKLRAIEADLFVSPDGFASLRTTVPQLLVMHDLNFEHYPELLPRQVAKFYRARFPRFAALAVRIATVSRYSARDINRTYGVSLNQIDVVYNGVNPEFKPLDAVEIQRTRDALTGGVPYFIYVGSLHPRKNIQRLLAAYDLFRAQHNQAFRLVLAGARMWKDPLLDQAFKAMHYKDEVVFTGRALPEQLARYVGAAEAMTFVPLFEGFGIPALEAFAAGVPLLASNTTALPEVCGAAALLVDPLDEEAIAAGMLRLSADAAYRQDAVARGFTQLQQFSWDRTAALLWESIEKTLADRNAR
jgi:glycosyltransferase involved in cell wall biosynthesis